VCQRKSYENECTSGNAQKSGDMKD